MKLIKLYLLALCLCLPNLLLAQEINLLLEEQLEEFATYRPQQCNQRTVGAIALPF